MSQTRHIKAIVTDIEGTTSSLSFVKDVLFPYARAQMGEFIQQHADEPAIAALIEDVRREAGEDLSLEGVIQTLEQWIDADKKITPLKALQGLLWETGYQQGDFKGHIYSDAKQQLEQWHQQGIKLYVYSSGSVHAQKLLFGYTEYGDLNYLFNGYFDTRIGAKIEPESYRHIAEAIKLPANEILFLSDVKPELDAAKVADMQTTWLVRDSDLDPQAPHSQVKDFSVIRI
ncbi:MAG: acireductone synthase [Gammaproteobacteria bacterium]|jgi:enolase-phosphatase E1